jgi:hypothetical protein
MGSLIYSCAVHGVTDVLGRAAALLAFAGACALLALWRFSSAPVER